MSDKSLFTLHGKMRLKKEIIKKRCKGPLRLAKFLDLSGLELVKLAKLDKCQQLHWLIAQDNNLTDDEGIEHLSQLWHLDLSNNMINYLTSLSKFLALGTLILAHNDLKWVDLEKLRHAHILSLSLHNNPQLDSDPYYRIHVIDCLPLIWELDGRLVTVTERLHVHQFFIDTAYTDKPVRHKLGGMFKTTALKNIGTEGIVSQECKYIYSKFPMSETHTKHTDERRLKYLAKMMQQDIMAWSYQLADNDPRKPNLGDASLVKLMEERKEDPERCNMVLLLLVTSLQFQLPTALMKGVLTTSKLSMIGKASTMPFFLLPRAQRTKVACLLLNAAKVDRDNHVNNEGGLYPQLFMCLYHTVAQLVKISQTSEKNRSKLNAMSSTSDFMTLMASEVVSLMLSVVKYYYYLGNDDGVIKLTLAATGSMEVILEAQNMIISSGFGGSTVIGHLTTQEIKVKKFLSAAIEKNMGKVNIRMSDIPIGDRYLALSDSLPIKPLHSVIWASDFLMKGETVPCLDPPILNPEREAAKPKPQQPKMGDKVLLGPQVVGTIKSLMESDIAMVQIDGVPVSSGGVESKLKSSDAHYTYVDLKAMCFARDIGMWRPILTTGDNEPDRRDERYTIHSTDTSQLATVREALLASGGNTEPLIYTPRSKTPVPAQPDGMRSGYRPNPTTLNYQRQLNLAVVRRIHSAAIEESNKNTHNLAQVSDQELEEAFPEMEHDVISDGRKAITFPARAGRNDKAGKPKPLSAPVLNTDTLHLHDNVHHIRGLTPRDDSARSHTLSATTTDASTSMRSQKASHQEPVTSRTNSPSEMNQTNTELESQSIVEAETVHDNTKDGTSEQDKVQTNKEKDVGEASSDPNQPSNPATEESVAQESPPSQTDEREDERTDGKKDEKSKEEVEEEAKEEKDQADKSVVGGDELPKEEGGVTGDGCPVCEASNKEDTFITSVTGQSEGLNTSTVQEQDQVVNDSLNQSGAKLKKSNEDSNLDSSFRDHIGMKRRPMSSTPSGAIRLMVGDTSKAPQGRPQSAMEGSRFGMVTHPPSVVTPGTDSGTQATFKTDFQQKRVEAWRNTTRKGKPRPHTAVVQRSSATGLQFPPPQRPTSPIATKKMPRQPRLKITRTENWLAGGRDLYWDEVRKRPKSGHTPGWKEGLPASMRKQRPKSAYITLGGRSMMSSLPTNSFFVNSCANCRSRDVLHQGDYSSQDFEGLSVMYSRPHSYHGMMGPPSRPMTSPFFADETEDPLPQIIGEAEIRSGLYVRGQPPKSLPGRARRSDQHHICSLCSFQDQIYHHEDFLTSRYSQDEERARPVTPEVIFVSESLAKVEANSYGIKPSLFPFNSKGETMVAITKNALVEENTEVQNGKHVGKMEKGYLPGLEEVTDAMVDVDTDSLVGKQRPLSGISTKSLASRPDSSCFIVNGSKDENVVYVDDSGSFFIVKPPLNETSAVEHAGFEHK